MPSMLMNEVLLVHPALYERIRDDCGKTVPLPSKIFPQQYGFELGFKVVQDPYVPLTVPVKVRRAWRMRSSRFVRAGHYRWQERYVAYWLNTETLERTMVMM